MLEGTTSNIQSMMTLEVPFMRRSYIVIKRAFDVILSIGFLILCGPLMLAIAIAIKLDSPGPIVFLQTRIGKGGRPFRMYKFRTMLPDAEFDDDRNRAFIKVFVHGQIGSGEENIPADIKTAIFRMKTDPRVTRVGRVLRRSFLDELPQLFNVLKGDMSLVGPRPALPYEVQQYTEDARLRLSVSPGMTGLMQVSRGHGYEEMMASDSEYVRQASLWVDLKILLKTMIALLEGKGAY